MNCSNMWYRTRSPIVELLDWKRIACSQVRSCAVRNEKEINIKAPCRQSKNAWSLFKRTGHILADLDIVAKASAMRYLNAIRCHWHHTLVTYKLTQATVIIICSDRLDLDELVNARYYLARHWPHVSSSLFIFPMVVYLKIICYLCVVQTQAFKIPWKDAETFCTYARSSQRISYEIQCFLHERFLPSCGMQSRC